VDPLQVDVGRFTNQQRLTALSCGGDFLDQTPAHGRHHRLRRLAALRLEILHRVRRRFDPEPIDDTLPAN
jgi:hypothetical protein